MMGAFSDCSQGAAPIMGDEGAERVADGNWHAFTQGGVTGPSLLGSSF